MDVGSGIVFDGFNIDVTSMDAEYAVVVSVTSAEAQKAVVATLKNAAHPQASRKLVGWNWLRGIDATAKEPAIKLPVTDLLNHGCSKRLRRIIRKECLLVLNPSLSKMSCQAPLKAACPRLRSYGRFKLFVWRRHRVSYGRTGRDGEASRPVEPTRERRINIGGKPRRASRRSIPPPCQRNPFIAW
jgi:hypothetical protein